MSIESIVKQASFEHLVQQGREQALADLLAADPAFAPAPTITQAIESLPAHESESVESDPTSCIEPGPSTASSPSTASTESISPSATYLPVIPLNDAVKENEANAA